MEFSFYLFWRQSRSEREAIQAEVRQGALFLQAGGCKKLAVGDRWAWKLGVQGPGRGGLPGLVKGAEERVIAVERGVELVSTRVREAHGCAR